MYMTLEYEPHTPGAVPEELHVRAAYGHEGPEYGYIDWDPNDMSDIRVDDDTRILAGPVRYNGAPGLAPMAMQAGRLLAMRTRDGGAATIRSVRFGREAGSAGFALDGTPDCLVSEPDFARTLRGFFCRRGLFCGQPEAMGGLYTVRFDRNVSWDLVSGFAAGLPAAPLGVFCLAFDAGPEGAASPRACYAYACQDHADADLSMWLSYEKQR